MRTIFFTVFSSAAFIIALALSANALTQRDLGVPVGSPSQGPPDGWNVKQWKGKADFKVVSAEFGPAIHLKSSGTSSALYRELKFDLKEYPYLSWRWKVTSLPKGADVRRETIDDQAAQVYVVFPRWPKSVNSRLLGYIWESTAPAGLHIRSTKSDNTRYIVLKSGTAEAGKWVLETRNVYEDYRRLFNDEPPSVGSLSIMIDSDDTKSSAESFIGDIRFSKDPPSK